MLIAQLVGIENRSTMDMDTTIRNYSINIESLTKAIKEICITSIDDGVTFSFSSIHAIRDNDAYGGYRVMIIAKYDTITTPMQIDITTGDVITPNKVLYEFKMIFKEGSFVIWAYNIETVLAEKVETILRRGELNTRPRDFYDVYILEKTQTFEHSVFVETLKLTATHRETLHIFTNINNRLEEIKGSDELISRWTKYTKDYPYADGIPYEEVIESMRRLIQNL